MFLLFYVLTVASSNFILLQEAKESFASPDNSFYGKLHIVKLLYQ